jgi:hypothetical protein
VTSCTSASTAVCELSGSLSSIAHAAACHHWQLERSSQDCHHWQRTASCTREQLPCCAGGCSLKATVHSSGSHLAEAVLQGVSHEAGMWLTLQPGYCPQAHSHLVSLVAWQVHGHESQTHVQQPLVTLYPAKQQYTRSVSSNGHSISPAHPSTMAVHYHSAKQAHAARFAMVEGCHPP